jgi:c-di-GMP-binding flagellar brake protein YcgR
MEFNFEPIDINYIKISYIDTDGNFCSINTSAKKITENYLYVSVKLNGNLKIDIPQDVKINLICNDGLYQGDSTILSIENDLPYVLIKLEKPEEIVYYQNREYFRVKAKYPCLFRVKQENINKDFETETIDISANGVSILMPIFVKSEPSSNIELNIENRNIKIKAKYVRIEKCNDAYKISFSFINISNSDRDYISQICIKKQLEEKRKHFK